MRSLSIISVSLCLWPLVIAITYPVYYLSNYCDPNVTSIIRMGVTPYFANEGKRFSKDSSRVAKVKAAETRDMCDVVRNCSLLFRPPPDHSLLVTALAVDNGNDIGSLSVHIDNSMVWFWDDSHEFNKSEDFRQHSNVNGAVEITVTVKDVTTVWRHFKVSIILTAFKSEASIGNYIDFGVTCCPAVGVNESKSWCKDGFHFNCGNSHCIRRAYECDGYDNCGNMGDETFCGLDALSGGLLFLGVAVSLSFLALVFWLNSRPDIVRRILNDKDIDPDPTVDILDLSMRKVPSRARC